MRRLLAPIAILLLAVLAAAMPVGAAAQDAPLARAGVLDLPQGATQPLELRGEWGFAWQRFLPPEEWAAPGALAPVPGSWVDLAADGKPAGTDGWGSFQLEVRCPAGQRLALAVPAQRTAMRLYVNGQAAVRQGEPGSSAEAARAAIGSRSTVTEAFACPLRITVHLSNYSHRAGGMVRAPVLGPREALAAQFNQRLTQDAALLGAYLVLGLIPIIFFAARRKDPTPLLFGLFCLTQALYADMTGERLLLQPFGPDTGWETYLRIEYLAWFATMATFLMTVQKLFAGELRPLLVRLLLGCCAAGALAVLATPARIYSHLAPFGQALTVAIGLHVTWAVGRAARRGRTGASVLLGGMAFLLAVLLLDVLQYNTGGSRSVTPFGLLAFVLAPAVVLARRLARALNQEELRAVEQREKTDLLVRTTKAGIYDWDATRDAVSWSPRLKEMLGHAPDADTSAWPRLYHVLHPEDRDRERAGFMQQLRRRDVRNGEVRHPRAEFRLLRADGSAIWVMSEAIGLTGSDGRTLRYICSFVDITERRAMQETLLKQNTELETNARLREDVERMSRHDMKTPLNSVIGAIRLLREDARADRGQQELMGIAERASYRLLEMVNLSLDLYRMETGSYVFRPQAVDLAALLERVMQDMRSLAEAGRVRLQPRQPGGAPVYARAEELLCYSLLANLLKNAVEATPPGGTVTAELVPGDPIRLSIHNPGAVPPQLADNFFGKYASHGKSGGTGLGAYSARLMAHVQEGDLQMQSAPGAGTTLTLSLPALAPDAVRLPPPQVALAAQPTASKPPSPATQTGAGFGLRSVLVVDDDEYNRLLLRRYLPSPPFLVETAANGLAATEYVARHWPDIVLIDMEMPVMNGIDAVRWIRQQEQRARRPRCAIVMLSSNDDEASIRRGLEAGCDRFLPKPATRETLLSVLQELTGGSAGAPAAAVASPGDPVAVDPDLADEIAPFLASRRELAHAMAEALRAGDRDALRTLAHRAGGGLGLYGFHWAADQCRLIERQALGGDAAALAEALERLTRHLQDVRLV